MNKSDIILAVANKTNKSTSVVTDVLNSLIEVIESGVASGKVVRLVNFGTFQQRKLAARKYQNLNTKEIYEVPERGIPSFRAGKKFRQVVKG